MERRDAGGRRDRQYIENRAGPEEGTHASGDIRARDDGRARGFVPGRESVYVYDASGNVSGVPILPHEVPEFPEKSSEYAR